MSKTFQSINRGLTGAVPKVTLEHLERSTAHGAVSEYPAEFVGRHLGDGIVVQRQEIAAWGKLVKAASHGSAIVWTHLLAGVATIDSRAEAQVGRQFAAIFDAQARQTPASIDSTLTVESVSRTFGHTTATTIAIQAARLVGRQFEGGDDETEKKV